MPKLIFTSAKSGGISWGSKGPTPSQSHPLMKGWPPSSPNKPLWRPYFLLGVALGGLPLDFHDSWMRQVGELRSKLFKQQHRVQQKSPGDFLSKEAVFATFWVYQIGQQCGKVLSPAAVRSWLIIHWGVRLAGSELTKQVTWAKGASYPTVIFGIRLHAWLPTPHLVQQKSSFLAAH